MSDDDEIHSHLTNGAYLAMDDAFCACMRKAIFAGLESAPIGVVTTPGTKKPKYVPTERWPLTSSSGTTRAHPEPIVPALRFPPISVICRASSPSNLALIAAPVHPRNRLAGHRRLLRSL